MAEFGLVKPFDIDDGQLDGLSPQQCFVLGYELAQIDALLELPHAISRPVHAANRRRIKRSCGDSGRCYSLTWASDDVSESWMQLEVQAERCDETKPE